MSILETPRIIFGGKITWDPIVTNNYQELYDEGSAWTVFKKQETVEQFRLSATTKEAVVEVGNWNPHGTHRSVMYDTIISGVDLGRGVTDDDPLVGGPVDFKGMLVDCEPYGSQSSQLFFDQLALGTEGGSRIFAPRSHRVTARYINFYRLPRPVYNYAASVASVNWQTAFSKDDGLVIDAHGSPALKKLSKALEDDDVLGITIRFNAYSTHYYGAANSDEIDAREAELVEKFSGGGFQPNPARSYITGVVGLWRKGEPIHEPGDRALLAVPPSSQTPKKYIATVHARVNQQSIILDFSNAISETDLKLTKQDLGTLSLNVTDETSKTTNLTHIQYSDYNKAAYEKNSGIITLPLDCEQSERAKKGLLSLSGADGTNYLKEQALRAIPNDPNLYINEGENTTTDVLVLNKGTPVAAGQTIALVNPNVKQSIKKPLSEATTNIDGVATFHVTGQDGSVQGFVFMTDPSAPEPSAISTQVTTYMYVRTLPNNKSHLVNLDPTWENVYTHCLANWNAMAPCMDNWLDLKDPEQVKAYSSVIKRLTAPDNFESFLYMPVTRDMTETERKLLYAFLDSDDSQTPKSSKEKHKSNADVNHNELSKQMRQAKRR